MATFNLTVNRNVVEGTATEVSDRTYVYTDTAVVEYDGDSFTVAAGASDVLLNFGEIAPQQNLVLKFNGPLSVKFGTTGGTAIPFISGGILVLAGATVPNLYLTNAGTAGVQVERCVTD